MKLTSENVQTLMKACLNGSDEITDDTTVVEGITRKFGFSRDALMNHQDDIVSMLGQLPDDFHEGRGDGWSFLNACNDRDGNQWTGFHAVMEELFALGMGLGCVACLFPRDYWSSLPGGVPYYRVLSRGSQSVGLFTGERSVEGVKEKTND